MKYVSRVIPGALRHKIRSLIDSPYCAQIPTKETIGTIDRWTVVTSEFSSESVIYSGGVGEAITFEEELIRRYGVTVHVFDPSPVGRTTIARIKSDKIHFKAAGLVGRRVTGFAVADGCGENESWKVGSGIEVPTTTLRREMELNGHDSIDLLKLDIEGFEYGVLDDCTGIPIRQICVEFHDWMPEVPRGKTAEAIRTLQRRGFRLIHRRRHDHTFMWLG